MGGTFWRPAGSALQGAGLPFHGQGRIFHPAGSRRGSESGLLSFVPPRAPPRAVSMFPRAGTSAPAATGNTCNPGWEPELETAYFSFYSARPYKYMGEEPGPVSK